MSLWKVFTGEHRDTIRVTTDEAVARGWCDLEGNFLTGYYPVPRGTGNRKNRDR